MDVDAQEIQEAATHAADDVEPAAAVEPDAHAVQLAALKREYVFTPHCAHDADVEPPFVL